MSQQQVVVDNKWLLDHLKDPSVRIVEVDYDPNSAYNIWHIQGAVLIKWREDLRHPVLRDFIEPGDFEKLMEPKGISNNTTIHIVWRL